MTIFNEN